MLPPHIQASYEYVTNYSFKLFALV